MLKLCWSRRLLHGIGRIAAGSGERGRSVSSIADKHKDFLDLVKSHGEGRVHFQLSDNGEEREGASGSVKFVQRSELCVVRCGAFQWKGSVTSTWTTQRRRTR
jgi:hypothetical protein